MTDIAPGHVGLGGRISLVLVGGLIVIGFSSLVPVLPKISAHFADTPGAGTIVRAMITALGGAMAIGAPIGGLLAERFGERRLLLVALATFALAGIAGMVIDDLWLLLASRIVVGLALATCGVTAIATLANGVPDAERPRWLGFSSMFGNLATLGVMPVAVMLGAMDWRLVFTLHLAALPILLLILTLVPAPPVARTVTARVEGGGFPWAMLGLGLVCGGVATTLPAYLPFHFTEIGESNPRYPALAIMALTLGAGTLSFAYGWVRRFAGPAKIFVGGFLIVGLALLLVIAGHSVTTTLIGTTLLGVGVGLLSPNLFAVAAADLPERRARRIGLARAGYFGAALLAQIPLEPVAARYGAQGAFVALAGFAFAMALVMLAGRARLAPPAIA
ncbi:MFS transporter [Sphingomonas naphthae]|uniref:MFS transporter n=1 Tax=Sphingomonas naphthae TaxID=1813468 RepID=A0ABY7TMK4_9SPHN|nr:MFS transporter [Sphingomonas naphthae]WCT73991.1 MFS transporter [Sphingomonas naphthae]